MWESGNDWSRHNRQLDRRITLKPESINVCLTDPNVLRLARERLTTLASGPRRRSPRSVPTYPSGSRPSGIVWRDDYPGFRAHPIASSATLLRKTKVHRLIARLAELFFSGLLSELNLRD